MSADTCYVNTDLSRIGCAPPPVVIGNLVPNPSFEDVTITGAVASWALFTQHEQRDQRCMLSSDTMYAHTGRHSAKLVLPTPTPGGVVSYKGGLAVPFSLGSGVGNCGSGYQGFLLKAGFRYNISIWARSDDPVSATTTPRPSFMPHRASIDCVWLRRAAAGHEPVDCEWALGQLGRLQDLGVCRGSQGHPCASDASLDAALLAGSTQGAGVPTATRVGARGAQFGRCLHRPELCVTLLLDEAFALRIFMKRGRMKRGA